MNTALFIHSALMAGFSLSDLDEVDYGTVIDVITEISNDSHKYKEVATQEDFDKF
jgi:CheY-specific phosphatase CheX